MIFTLRMGSETLVGVVGKNGQLYWGAVSVGRLLRYKSPYYFSRRKSTVQVKDVAFDHLLDRYVLQSLQLKILTHNRVLGLLEKCTYEHAQLIHDHLNRGNFYVDVVLTGKGPLYPYVRLCAPNTPHAQHFFEWIEEWKRGTLNAAAMRTAAFRTATTTATWTTVTTTSPGPTPAAAPTEPATIPTTTEPATVPTTTEPATVPTTSAEPATVPTTTEPATYPTTTATTSTEPATTSTEPATTSTEPIPKIPVAIELTKIETIPVTVQLTRLPMTTDADDEREEEDVKPPPVTEYSPTTPAWRPERGANSVGKWQLKEVYNAYGSPGYTFTERKSPLHVCGASHSSDENIRWHHMPYSPSNPPYSPSQPAYAPPSPPPPQQQQQPPLQEEQDQPLDLSQTRIGGLSFWFDGIPGTKMFIFQGSNSYTYCRKTED